MLDERSYCSNDNTKKVGSAWKSLVDICMTLEALMAKCLEQYTPEDNQWVEQPTMRVQQGGCAGTAVVGDLLCVVGGTA